MGRELRRKQAKRDGKNVREVQKKYKEKPLSPKTFVIIMIVVLSFLVILGILTGIFITKDINLFDNNNETSEEETVTEVKNKILAIDSLRQAEEDYYVYYYDTTKANPDIENALSKAKEKVYRVDLNNELNSNFVGEPSGKVKKIEDLKVSNPTLIKVSSEKIKSFYSGVDKITKALS